MTIIHVGVKISKYSTRGIFNRFLSINRTKAFALFFLSFFIFSTCFSQETKVNVEIRSAIENVKIGNYEKAIPVFKKNLNSKKNDEFTNLEIQIFLGFCNLVTKKGKVDVENLNLKTKNYFEKQEKFSRDSLANRKEAEVYYFLAQINRLSNQFNEAVFYLLNVNDYYEKENLTPDEIYSKIVYQLGLSYYNLGNFNSTINYSIKAFNLNNDLNGGLNEFSLNILVLIYESYYRLYDYENSIIYLNTWLNIRKNLFGEEDRIYLTNLNFIGQLYRKNGEYSKSKEINLRLVEIGKKVWGETSIEYLKYLNNLGDAYDVLGEYKNSLSINSRLSDLSKVVLGEGDSQYILTLNNLALNQLHLGEPKTALTIINKAEDLAQKYLEEDNPVFLAILGNQSSIYTKLGEFKLAFEVNQKVLNITKNLFGEEHPDYLFWLHNSAGKYSDLGDFKSAIETIELVIKSRKKILGETHPDYLRSLSLKSVLHSYIGDYTSAIEINKKVLETLKQTLGELHPSYLIALSNLARCFSNLGDFKSAIDIDLKILKARKENLGENHIDYSISLVNLASDYAYFGDYKSAIRYNEIALNIRKEKLGNYHPAYFTALNNQATYISYLGDFKSAIDIDLKILQARKETLGENHPDYLITLSNLAFAYSQSAEFTKALEINQKVLDSRLRSLGKYHPDYFNSLNNLAQNFSDLGDIERALILADSVFLFRKSFFGKNHPEYLSILSNVAVYEYLNRKYSEAYFHFDENLKSIQEKFIEFAGILGETLTINFWKKTKINFESYFGFFEKINEKECAEIKRAYDVSLFSKGILLNISRDFESLLTENGSLETLEKFRDLKLLKLQIQRLYEKPISERYLDVDSLENAAREIESELITESKEYGDYTQNLKITWKDVQSNLGENDVAIEFIDYPTIEEDTVKYAALVLRSGWENPKFVPLFRKDQIDRIVNRGPNQIYSNGIIGKELKTLVWDPLEEFMAPGDRVYFSAAGILHQLAIENLSFDESTTLGDRYQMNRLSSTKELALKKPESKNQNVALYGGIKYDLSLDQMIAGSKKYGPKDSFLAVRGIDEDSLDRKGWQFLPGTLAEANEVSQILRENQYQVTEFIGVSGSEESLKDLSGKRTGIIHIATHGFFLPVEQSKRNPFIQMRFDDRNANAGYVDPMLRSGLLLAGGNRAWQGDSIPETIEDGVLTAKEISQLDLRETDLVVLSACETGLGDVSSEGVFGLQRAFKQAGAQTIIMSLWNVKDEATQYLMTNFYSYLTQGASKRDAFIQARNKCRERYQDPASWAAFIMLD